MILNRIISAAFDYLGDVGPFVVHDAMHEKQDPFLLLVPVDFLNARVQVVVPTFAALLPHSTVEVLGDERPLLRTVRHDQLQDVPVFFSCPCALHVEGLALSPSFLLLIKRTLVSLFNRKFRRTLHNTRGGRFLGGKSSNFVTSVKYYKFQRE